MNERMLPSRTGFATIFVAGLMLAGCGGKVAPEDVQPSRSAVVAGSGTTADGPFVVNVAALPAASPGAGTSGPQVIHQHARPPLPAGTRQATRAAIASAAAAPGTGAAPLVTFEGQGQTEWAPPDTNGAVSSQFVVTTVNNRLTIRDRSGTQLSTVNLDDFWRPLPTTTNSFDTRSRFDPYGQRFIVMSSGSLGDIPNSGILLAVSQTSNPTGNWFLFRVKVDPASQMWADYPTLGFNKKWIMVSANLFGPTFDTRIWLFNKAAVYAGTGTVTVFPGVGVTAQAAETYDAALEDLYVLQLDSDSSTALLRVTGAVGSEHIERIASIEAPLAWSGPPSVPQLGSTQLIPAGIDWMMDCVYRNGSIWGSHEVQPLTGPTRSAFQWWRISPQGQLQDFGRIDDATGAVSYGMGALAVNKNNDVVAGYTRFSADSFPSAAYSFRAGADPAGTFRAGVVYRNGDASYGGNRWGDFSHTQVDPVDDTTLWTVQEYAAAGGGSWGTWWAEVSAQAASQQVDVLLKSGVVTSVTQSPHPQIQVVNTGASPLALNSLTIRYWFNCDCSPGAALNSAVDWAGILPPGQAITGNVTRSFQTTTASGQTHSLVLGFTGGLVLNPGQTVQVESRFSKADNTNMNQANDWSFAPFPNYTEWSKVTVYLNGALVAGQSP